MLITLPGIIMLAKPQPWNAFCPIEVTLLGIVMFVRLEQAKKAVFPMLVTLLGIVMLVSPVAPSALLPIVVILLGITMLVRLEQPKNTPFPMTETPSPIKTLVRPKQFSKASSPMSITLSGIVMLVNFVQY
jgi:hypothetical protein